MRHYEELEANLIEIWNEVVLVTVIIYLLIMDEETKWTKNSINWFLYILISNSMIVMVIIIGKTDYKQAFNLVLVWKILSCIKWRKKAQIARVHTSKPSTMTLPHPNHSNDLKVILIREFTTNIVVS